jgi:hypothetical protein
MKKKINNGDFVFIDKLKINNYDHKSNTFECYPEGQKYVSNNEIYLPGQILGVSKTYVYEPLTDFSNYDYDVGLDLKYHVMVNLKTPITRHTDYEKDNYQDDYKNYQVNKFYKKEMGSSKKRADYKEREHLDDKVLPYKLYTIEPSRFYATNGEYEMIPAEMDLINEESAYYNKGTHEPVIIKTAPNKSKILSMHPEGDKWVNAIIHSNQLEGVLLDVLVTHPIRDIKEARSMFLDYPNGIPFEVLHSFTDKDDIFVQVEMKRMILNIPFKHIRFE